MWWIAPALAVLVIVAVTSTRLSELVPAATAVPLQARTTTVTGRAPRLTFPAAGQAAVMVPALGRAWPSGPEAPVPIASLTKVMTAYVVLRDHPVGPQAPGPTLVMTAADQRDVQIDTGLGGTTIPVRAGERLTLRQLLDGLMVHSANNFADTLAMWDAGSLGAFVARMNATARAMGLTRTHYVDTNGLNPRSVSTAGDQVRLTSRAMTVPTFAAVVDQPKVTLPMVGTLDNLVTAIGSNGIVGVKSGFLQAAMGCVILAAERPVGDREVLVLAAVTGQPGFRPLTSAQDAAVSLIDSAAAGLRLVPVVTATNPVATVDAPWQQGSRLTVSATGPIDLLARSGDRIRTALVFNGHRAAVPPGTVMGSLVATNGPERAAVPVVSDVGEPRPSMGWHIHPG